MTAESRAADPPDLDPPDLRPGHLDPADLGPADLGPAERSPADLGPAERSPAQPESARPAPAEHEPAAAAVDPAAVPVDPEAPILNVANLLTAARLAMVPLFGWCLVWSELDSPAWRIVATIAFGVASVTDYVDGALARRFNLVTAFGKVADPIADKALVGTALVLLSAYGPVPWWVTVLILTRELGVTALRFVVIRHGVIPASPGGKLKTLLQSLAIGWLLLPLPDWLDRPGLWLMYVATAVTVGTGIDYVVRAVRLRRDGRT